MRASNEVFSLIAAVLCVSSSTASQAYKNPIYMYVDEWSIHPSDLVKEFVRMADAGVSHIIMAFHLEGNPGFPSSVADTAAIWQKLTQSERADALNTLHARGTKLLISSGGESEGDYWLRQDPELYASKVCNLIKSLGADGIDFDKEGFSWTTGDVLEWTNRATRQCREVWPEAIITSAPQSPHLMTQGAGVRYTDGILSGAGHDHYLIQYYNQGTWTQDTTYTGLVSGQGVGAVLETMQAYGGKMKPDQLVIGKPFTAAHAGSGFVEHSKLREILCRAYDEIGYRGGLMFWKLPYGQDLSSVTMLAASCSPEPAAPTTPSAPAFTGTSQPRPSTVDVSTRQIPSQAATTAPVHLTASMTRSSPPNGLIEDCRQLVDASEQFATFAEVCKDFCSDYADGGPLTPWCSENDTASKVARCVVSQRTFCQMKDH